jgi:LmbE family N-acetylglucosaminyl deacetylase
LKNSRNAILSMASLITLGWAGTRHGKLFLRRNLSRLVGGALFLRSRRLRLGAFKTVLVIAPHPDDETFGCGGTLALAVRAIPSVHVLFITDGGASHPGHSLIAPETLASMRLEEAHLATEALGVDWRRVSFLNERDGTLGGLTPSRHREVAGAVASRLSALRPDAIFLPKSGDGSSEHESAFALVRDAVLLAGITPRILGFPVWSWWNPLLLARSLPTVQRIWRVDVRSTLGPKAHAMACYASQTKPLPPDTDPALPEGFALMFLGGYEFYIEH